MARLMMVHMLRANNSALHGISGSYRKVASAQTPKDLEKQSMRNTITLGDGFTLRTLSLSVVQTSYGSLVGTCCSLWNISFLLKTFKGPVRCLRRVNFHCKKYMLILLVLLMWCSPMAPTGQKYLAGKWQSSGSQPWVILPLEHVTVSGNILGFQGGGGGCYWPLVGSSQGWCSTSYNTQTAHTRKTYPAPKVCSAVAEKPWARENELEVKKVKWASHTRKCFRQLRETEEKHTLLAHLG